MIIINYITVNSSADKIALKVTTNPGNKFTQILVWDKDNYKDYPSSYDVSNLIVGTSNTEIIEIPATALMAPGISGIYFIEFTTNESLDNISIGVVANFATFYECLFNRLKDIDISGCGKPGSNSCGTGADTKTTYFITSLLETLNQKIIQGQFEDSIDIVNILEDICDPCCGYTEIPLVGPQYTWSKSPYDPSVIEVIDSNGDPVSTASIVGNIVTINNLPCSSAIVQNSTTSPTYTATIPGGGTLVLPENQYNIYVDGVLNQTFTALAVEDLTINITA